MLVERSYNPPPLRQQMLEICMEELDVPAIFFGRDATLSCYACGRTTGTVVDIGHFQTVVTPVYEGYVEQKAIRRSPIGSLAMDELALKHLDAIAKGGPVKPLYQVRNPNIMRHESFHRMARLYIAKDCRESGAGQSVTAAASKTLHVPSMSYTLPDGQTVDVPSPNRFEVAELVLGRGGAAGIEEGDGQHLEGHQKTRQDAVAAQRKQYSSFILNATTQPEEDDDDDEEDDSEKKKYTEATAVGVSQRRNKRGASKGSTKKTSAATSAKSKTAFNNWQLQRACSSYLQAHTEQLAASPIASMVCDAAFRCDRDQQASLLGNIVLGGGGACIGPTDQAVPDLLREQVEAIIHTHTPGWRVKVLSPGMQERAICSWLGGSILGSLGTFHDMWITKAEYEEWGSAVVNRKCP
jgi:actin-related protein